MMGEIFIIYLLAFLSIVIKTIFFSSLALTIGIYFYELYWAIKGSSVLKKIEDHSFSDSVVKIIGEKKYEKEFFPGSDLLYLEKGHWGFTINISEYKKETPDLFNGRYIIRGHFLYNLLNGIFIIGVAAPLAWVVILGYAAEDHKTLREWTNTWWENLKTAIDIIRRFEKNISLLEDLLKVNLDFEKRIKTLNNQSANFFDKSLI